MKNLPTALYAAAAAIWLFWGVELVSAYMGWVESLFW